MAAAGMVYPPFLTQIAPHYGTTPVMVYPSYLLYQLHVTTDVSNRCPHIPMMLIP